MYLIVELSVSDKTCSVALVSLLCDHGNRILYCHCIHCSVRLAVYEVTVDAGLCLVIYRVSRVHADCLSDSALVCEVVLCEHALSVERHCEVVVKERWSKVYRKGSSVHVVSHEDTVLRHEATRHTVRKSADLADL